MDGAPSSNPRARKDARWSASLPLVAQALLAACASRSLTGGDVALGLSARSGPGLGAAVEVSQVMVEHAGRRLDLELGIERQRLDDEGPAGDDWTRIWSGLRWWPCELSGPTAHAGVTWLRSEAATDELDRPGDYGGGYIGAGWLFALAPALATGPDLDFLYMDAEGDRGSSGGVFQLAWRFVWQL